MKQFYTLLAGFLLTASTFAQIGINNENPDAFAALDITSTTAGLLMPRMTNTQRQALPSRALGLMVFCTDGAFGEGQLQIRYSSEWKNAVGEDITPAAALTIGDFYQGGVVFYILQSEDTGYVAGETHGLIAAVEDQSAGILGITAFHTL